MGRWIWVFQKNKKGYERTHELFNMNHNRYEITKTSFNFVIFVWIEPYRPYINMHNLNMCIYYSHEIRLTLHVLSNNEKLPLHRDQQGVQSYVLLLKKNYPMYVTYLMYVSFCKNSCQIFYITKWKTITLSPNCFIHKKFN
jgi:hypothetical protein